MCKVCRTLDVDHKPTTLPFSQIYMIFHCYRRYPNWSNINIDDNVMKKLTFPSNHNSQHAVFHLISHKNLLQLYFTLNQMCFPPSFHPILPNIISKLAESSFLADQHHVIQCFVCDQSHFYNKDPPQEWHYSRVEQLSCFFY